MGSSPLSARHCINSRASLAYRTVRDLRHKLTGPKYRFCLSQVLPVLQQDIFDTANKWGSSGRIDPFTDIYNVGPLRGRKFSLGCMLNSRL